MHLARHTADAFRYSFQPLCRWHVPHQLDLINSLLVVKKWCADGESLAVVAIPTTGRICVEITIRRLQGYKAKSGTSHVELSYDTDWLLLLLVLSRLVTIRGDGRLTEIQLDLCVDNSSILFLFL